MRFWPKKAVLSGICIGNVTLAKENRPKSRAIYGFAFDLGNSVNQGRESMVRSGNCDSQR